MRPRRGDLLPYGLLLPTILFMALFFVVPLVQVFLLAFQSDEAAVTTSHFARMAGDIYFPRAARNTLLLTAAVIPLQLIVAFAAALIVNRRGRGAHLLLSIYAIPLGISELAAGLIWLSIFTERGYLNSLLVSLGVLERPLLYLSFQSPEWLLYALVVTEVWRATPLVMMILLAGLQMIARDYLEAADTFGATLWQKIRFVILPLLRPSIQSALIIRTMLALQVFGPVIVLTGRLFPVLASESYFWYQIVRNEHVAAAYALLLMVISMAITWAYVVFLRTREEQVGVI